MNPLPLPSPIVVPVLSARRLLGRFLWRGLMSLGLGVIVACCLTLLLHQRFASTLVYSLCISLMSWFCIDGSRMLAARWVNRRVDSPAAARQWPGWPWMVTIIPIGTVVGFSVGNELANLITGYDEPGLAALQLRQAASLFVISLIPSVAITYLFYSRERLASTEARAQAAQRQATQHQLKLLESQLEPHMLFNTLANLRVLIGVDPPRAQLMLDRMIAYLRATLSASRAELHPLSAEFSRVADYAELMQVRMGERLQVQLVLPSALAQQPVPPLLLQPLVENAIKHGLEPHVAGGTLVVSAEVDGGDLLLSVRDTGVGLASAAALSPAMSAAPLANSGFGLQQVRERLSTLYGLTATLELLPAPDAQGGTLARLRMPLTADVAAARSAPC